jgi:hypothetical protein
LLQIALQMQQNAPAASPPSGALYFSCKQAEQAPYGGRMTGRNFGARRCGICPAGVIVNAIQGRAARPLPDKARYRSFPDAE